MPGLSDYSGASLLEWLVGKTAMPAQGTAYIALFTTMPNDANSGGVESDAASLVRKSTAGSDWNAASGSAPRSLSNAQPITFATPTGDPTVNPVIGFGIYDAPSGGNLKFADYLGAYDWLPFMVDDAATDLVDAKAHAYAAGDRVVFSAEPGGTLPAGISAGTLYHVIASGLVTDGFKVSTTAGGAAVDITGTGNGMVRKVTPMTINNGIAPVLAAGQIVLKAA